MTAEATNGALGAVGEQPITLLGGPGPYRAVALRARYEPHDHDDPGVASDEPVGFVKVQVSVGAGTWFDVLDLPVSWRYDDEPDDELLARATRDWFTSRAGVGHAHTVR